MTHTNVDSNLLSSSEGTSASYLALKQTSTNSLQYINTEMGRQNFARKKTVIGCDALLEIPRNHMNEKSVSDMLLS